MKSTLSPVDGIAAATGWPPPSKAIAGDYATSISAASHGQNGSAQFRVTVTTSTMWGIAGVGIIGAALLIMVGAVARFGRR